MGDQFVERCEQAKTDLHAIRLNATDDYEAERLRGKTQGLDLALSYLSDYPTSDAETLGNVRAALTRARYILSEPEAVWLLNHLDGTIGEP